MNKHSTLRTSGSLLERASEIYDFRTNLRGPSLPDLPERLEEEVREQARPAPAPTLEPQPQPVVEVQPEPVAEAAPPAHDFPIAATEVDDSFDEPSDFMDELELAEPVEPKETPHHPAPSRRGKVDRRSLREGGFIMPDAPVTELAEEFRIVKRQLLQAASGKTGIAEDKRRTILVSSAAPDEGKTFSAVNLALSLAGEKDVEVLLVDGDFTKPEVLSILGIEGGPGLTDAIADPASEPESFVIQTDIERLSVLPAGRQANGVHELLTSERTRQVLDALTAANRRRIVVFDSPPALMASTASVLASKVGQVLMVVRADKTTESDLREAIGLLSGCENISLMLNGAGFAATGRRFGSYYGYGQ